MKVKSGQSNCRVKIMNEKYGNEKFQSNIDNLINHNKFLQNRIVILEENQHRLEKALRDKDLRLQKLEMLVTDANKKVLEHMHVNVEIKSEVKDAVAAADQIKKEMAENVESGFQKNLEYSETTATEETKNTFAKEEERKCLVEETSEIGQKKKRKRRSGGLKKLIRKRREREKQVAL